METFLNKCKYCEYKQNELSVIMEIDDNNKLKIHHLNAEDKIEKLEAENKKLRDINLDLSYQASILKSHISKIAYVDFRTKDTKFCQEAREYLESITDEVEE